MNPLATRPDLRRKVYAAFWIASLILGSLVVVFGAAHWLVVTLAVYAYLGGVVGYQAQANTSA